MSSFPMGTSKTLLLPSVMPKSDICMSDILKRLDKAVRNKYENSPVRRLKRTRIGYSRPNKPIKNYPKSVKNISSMEIKPVYYSRSRGELPASTNTSPIRMRKTSKIDLSK